MQQSRQSEHRKFKKVRVIPREQPPAPPRAPVHRQLIYSEPHDEGDVGKYYYAPPPPSSSHHCNCHGGGCHGGGCNGGGCHGGGCNGGGGCRDSCNCHGGDYYDNCNNHCGRRRRNNWWDYYGDQMFVTDQLGYMYRPAQVSVPCFPPPPPRCSVTTLVPIPQTPSAMLCPMPRLY